MSLLPRSKYAYRKCWHCYVTSHSILQIASFAIRDWQTRNDEARLKDQTALHERLNNLDSNQNDLKKMLSESLLLSYYS